MTKSIPWLLALACAGLFAATSASATSFSLTALLDGAQETPPVITLGTGSLTGTYDDVTNALSWSGSFSSLNSGTTNAHFHGPAAPGVGPAGACTVGEDPPPCWASPPREAPSRPRCSA